MIEAKKLRRHVHEIRRRTAHDSTTVSTTVSNTDNATFHLPPLRFAPLRSSQEETDGMLSAEAPERPTPRSTPSERALLPLPLPLPPPLLLLLPLLLRKRTTS